MKHLCVKISESNQNVAYCVNQQREGIKGMFDNTLLDVEDLDIDIDFFIKNTIDGRNGEEEVMRLIDEEEINDSGFANQDNRLWLTVGTYADLIAEVEQEIEYQRNNRIESIIDELAENYIDNMIAESDMDADVFYRVQAGFYRKNESHISDCFTDTSYAVKDIPYAEKYELQSKLENRIVKLVKERA